MTAPAALPYGSRIGILGGGQLGRMMSVAASRLGYHVHIFTPEKDSPAAEVSAAATVASYDDEAALSAFAASIDVATLEFENVPVAALDIVACRVPVHPGKAVLEVTQHRVREKELARALGIGTAPFAAVDSLADLQAALAKLGTPAILKTCRLGYDGKGQARITHPDEAEAAWDSIGGDAAGSAILEGLVDFTAEISVIVARGLDGAMQAYPAVRNEHRNQMLHETTVPCGQLPALEKAAADIAHQLAKKLEVIGLLAVELFVTRDSTLLMNEMAPRPHNSGHWTMDAAQTDQFEQAIRAVAGLPLGPSAMRSPARMRNLIGAEALTAGDLLIGHPEARLHLYGKREARAGRKMGHITYLGG